MKLSIIIPNFNEPNIGGMVRSTIRAFPHAQIIVAHDPEGKGKGWAIREGLNQAYGDTIAFIDGDGDISPVMLNRLLPFLDYYDIVVGCKDVRGFFLRRLITMLSRWYIYLMFGLEVDTQTGVKVFKSHAIPEWNTDSFAFDVELLTKAKKMGFTMVDVPVAAYIRRKIKAGSIWKTLKETLKIYQSVRSTR